MRDGATCGHVTWHADYLNPQDADAPNQVDKSLQTTRRFDALKLWMTLRAMGADADRRDVRRGLDLAARCTTSCTRHPDFEVAAAPS